MRLSLSSGGQFRQATPIQLSDSFKFLILMQQWKVDEYTSSENPPALKGLPGNPYDWHSLQPFGAALAAYHRHGASS